MEDKPWYSKGLRFECQRCGECCKSHGEYAHLYFTDEEVTAVAAWLELPEEAFRARFLVHEDGHNVLRQETPVCPFLSAENRCTVYPVRPRQCRSWPFWEENLKPATWNGPVRAICPGIGQGPLHSARTIEHIASATEEWYEG